MRNFNQEINQLLSGEISEILVSKDEFFSFRDVWSKHPQKSDVIGEAILGGGVRYSVKSTTN